MPEICWVDGRLQPLAEPAVRVDDSAFACGRGCYSTARWTGSAVRFEARHLARLARDAAGLGIGAVCVETARRALRELGRAAFGDAEGVLRLQASRAADGAVQLVATGRAIGPEPDRWRAITLPLPHEGATLYAGAKVSNRLVHALAGDRVAQAGVEEGLLFDRAERLVEGTRANLVALGSDGAPCAPPASRGAVAGVALEIVAEAVPEILRRDVPRGALSTLEELVALNAVRGAVPIVEIDGRPVGSGRPGPLAARLAGALDAAA